MPLVPLIRRVDFVAENYIYALVRVLPVLAICPPRALPKTTLKSDARRRDVAQVMDADRRFHRRPDMAQGKVKFFNSQRALASFSRPTADRTYSFIFPQSSAPE